MLNKARIISFAVALASALGIMPGVCAEGNELLVEPNYTSYVITLRGSAGIEYAGELVNIEILKPVGEGVTTLPAVTPDNLDTAVALFSYTKVKADGSFEYKFKLSESAREENPFWARVNIDAASDTNGDIFLTKSFAYTSKTEIDAKLASFKSVVNHETLEADAQLMGITLPDVWSSFDAEQKIYSASVILSKIQADTMELTTETLKNHIIDGIMISSARDANTAEQLQQFLTAEAQAQYFGLDFTNTYYTQHTAKSEVFERMKGSITAQSEKTDIARIFRESLLLESVQSASYKNNVSGIINEFNDVIAGDNFAAYGNLNLTQLDSVNSAVISATDEQLATITAFDSMLRAAIRTATTVAPQGQPSPSRPSSSGGGGGMAIVEKPVTAPENISVTTVFSDISNYIWAENAITSLYEKGVISGKAEGKFCPADKVTREEIVKMICDAFGIAPKNDVSIFKDAKGKWFEGYVNAAYEKNIINGIDEENFGTGKAATREDIAVIFARTVGADGEGELTFGDSAQVSKYAHNAIFALNQKGVISGYPDGSFRPKNSMTRAEAAVVIYNLLNIYA